MKRHLCERSRLFTKGHPVREFIQENILVVNHHFSIIHFIYLSIYGVSILFTLDFPVETNFICSMDIVVGISLLEKPLETMWHLLFGILFPCWMEAPPHIGGCPLYIIASLGVS